MGQLAPRTGLTLVAVMALVAQARPAAGLTCDDGSHSTELIAPARLPLNGSIYLQDTPAASAFVLIAPDGSEAAPLLQPLPTTPLPGFVEGVPLSTLVPAEGWVPGLWEIQDLRVPEQAEFHTIEIEDDPDLIAPEYDRIRVRSGRSCALGVGCCGTNHWQLDRDPSYQFGLLAIYADGDELDQPPRTWLGPRHNLLIGDTGGALVFVPRDLAGNEGAPIRTRVGCSQAGGSPGGSGAALLLLLLGWAHRVRSRSAA